MTRYGGALRVGAPPPKSSLLRFARDPHTRQVAFDPDQRMAGRGAYLCPSTACFQTARKRNSLARALKTPVDPSVLDAAHRCTS